MDTVQIACTLKDISSFRGVYPPDLLPSLYNRALLLLMPILTLGKVYIGLQYILITHFPRHSILIHMGARHLTEIFFHS